MDSNIVVLGSLWSSRIFVNPNIVVLGPIFSLEVLKDDGEPSITFF